MERSSASSSGSPDSERRRLSGSPGRVYFDYAGFCPVDPRVVGVMRPFLEGGVGNPASPHSLGGAARESLEAARVKIARLIHGPPGGLVFTSGATEANNLAVKGVVHRAADRGRHVITSAIEHISVINPCRDLEKRGFSITYLPVDAEGRVDPDGLRCAIRPDTVLISITAASGEIGTIQPVGALSSVARDHGVPFHVDAVGAVGRLPVSVDEMGIDLLTLSSNDLYGPPGVGALWMRPGVKLIPLILGGGQEQGNRSGTENLPAIVGMGVAAELVRMEWREESARLAALRDRLLTGLLAALPGARLTGSRGQRLPHHLSLTLRGVKADGVLMDLDMQGVAASSGSACASRTLDPSHVLRAIGVDPEEQEGSLCFTLGRWSTGGEIETLLDLLPPIVTRLRALSPRTLGRTAS